MSKDNKTKTAAVDVEGPKHVLEGAWKVYWIDENVSTQMRVGKAFSGKGITTFMGGLATLSGEACPMTGTVVDGLAGQFSNGPEQRMLNISAFVVIRVQCVNSELWIEALGLPAGKVLMSGRATAIPKEGAQQYLPIGLGR